MTVSQALRVGIHNARSLAAHLEEAIGLYEQLNYGVVLVQETRASFFKIPEIRRKLLRLGRGWHSVFAPAQGPTCSGGTAILVRSDLVNTNILQPLHRAAGEVGDWEASSVLGAQGRFVLLRTLFHGQRVDFLSLYLPASGAGNLSAAHQRSQYIHNSLRPLFFSGHSPLLLQPPGAPSAPRAGTTPSYRPAAECLIVGGDFNFVDSPELDRLVASPPDPSADTWRSVFPSSALCDIFRLRHPTRRAFTRFSDSDKPSAGRLDRFLVSPSLLTRTTRCFIEPSCSFSDHCPGTLSFLPRSVPVFGPGRNRIRLNFLQTPDLLAACEAWVQAQSSAAPLSDRALLEWWPRFKAAFLSQCTSLQRQYWHLQNGDVKTLLRRLCALDRSIASGVPATVTAAVAERLQVRRQLTQLFHVNAQANALRSRRLYVSQGERPSPGLTAQLSRPAQASVMPPLRGRDGRLVPSGPKLAQLVANHNARISASPPLAPAARAARQAAVQAVLAPLSSQPHFTPAESADMGSRAVTEAEVARALKHSPSGRSPGLDGIPMELYRKFKRYFAPLLSRLFSAIGSLGDLPHRFHEGLVVSIYKKGDTHDPANYRPITLLNTDYRLLTKTLANRLLRPLDRITPPSQTAFLPGRQIGENIWLLQLLDAYLRRQQSHAFVLFCDFQKAYDTVDRAFLLAVMESLGAGPDLLRWVGLLLSDTRARALVNGFISDPCTSRAGTRQGDPLAPLLYLFVAIAFYRFLEARGHHLSLPSGLSLVAAQYADDAEIPFSSEADLPPILTTLSIFATASGQRLNHVKSEVVRFGCSSPTPPPASIAGISLVPSTVALGIQFGAQDPEIWTSLKSRATDRCDRLAKLYLSDLGRGLAASSYALSRILFHFEFLRPPTIQPNILKDLHLRVAALVDGPSRFRGLHNSVILGPPSQGGYGVLPLVEHLRSRHALWLYRILLQADRPWAQLAISLLSSYYPFFSPLALLSWPNARTFFCVAPLAIRHLVGATVSLPRPTPVPLGPGGHLPLTDTDPGPWCFHIPLASNPWWDPASPAFVEYQSSPRADAIAALLSALHKLCITSLGPFAFLCEHLLPGRTAPAGPGGLALLVPDPARLSFPFRGAAQPVLSFQDACQTLLSVIPDEWYSAALLAAVPVLQLGLPPPAGPQDGPAAALRLLASNCSLLTRSGPLPLSSLTVREATQCQFLVASEDRCQRWARFIEAATGAPVPDLDAIPSQMSTLFRPLSKLKWDNHYVSCFWRLVYDGFPTAARRHAPDHCSCGSLSPFDRGHSYWHCDVLTPLRDELQRCLPLVRPPLSQANLWLVQPPPGVHPLIWRVVSLSFVHAADHGRRLLYRLTVDTPLDPDVAVLVAQKSTRGRFWESLQDFSLTAVVSPRIRARVPPAHPFLCRSAGGDRLQLNRPPV